MSNEIAHKAVDEQIKEHRSKIKKLNRMKQFFNSISYLCNQIGGYDLEGQKHVKVVKEFLGEKYE